MLQLLLDAHVSPQVGVHLIAGHKKLVVHDLVHWEGGRFLSSPDEELLEVAFRQGLTLVTFDLSSIPRLLKDWAEQGIRHGGIIFVDERTISSQDIGGLIRALHQLYKDQHEFDWTDRVIFLRRREAEI